MKNYLLLLLTLTLSIASYGQRKIKTVEVKEEGLQVKRVFKPINDEVSYKGAKIKITPISAEELNSMFDNETGYNGEFNYSYYMKTVNSFFLKKNKKKKEKSDLEFLIEGADWLLENEKIAQNEHKLLVKEIYYNNNFELAEEIYNSSKRTQNNPFYINGKYLSVFKVEFTNNTNSFIPFNNEIFVESGNSIQLPLSSSFISTIQNTHNSVNKIIALERHNLEKGMMIPPYSKFTKLFAITPTNYNEKSLTISISGVNKKFKWNIDQNNSTIDLLHKFHEFKISWFTDGNYTFSSAKKYSIVDKSTGYAFFSEDNFLIEDKDLNSEIEIFALVLNNDKLYFKRMIIKGSDFLKKEKNRRYEIKIGTKKISELKRKL